MPAPQSQNLAYLTKPRFCLPKTALALGLTLLGIIALTLTLTLAPLFHKEVELGHQIKLLFEFTFLAACITALWKHAILN